MKRLRLVCSQEKKPNPGAAILAAACEGGLRLPSCRAPLAALLAPLVLAGLVLPGTARAWGAEGHRIVALVADQLLDARTRASLRQIAGGQSLEDIGLWMDRERDSLRQTLPGSPRWHFDNRPVCAASAGLERYCADGQCASRVYARYLARLADRSLPPAERLEALRIVSHLIGDAHQPLHAADHDDRGGNQIDVRIGRRGRPQPLHAAWDRDFVKFEVRGSSEQDYAAQLVAAHRQQAASLARGDFRVWIGESYQIAREFGYGRLPGFACETSFHDVVRLPPEYVDGARAIVRERLARAGIRLAAVLRATL